jgi:DNA repair protein RadA/Sms
MAGGGGEAQMGKKKTQYRCRECGHIAARWLGRCPGCDAWSTLEEEPMEASTSSARVFRLPEAEGSSGPQPLDGIEASDATRLRTGSGELDRVLGGGLVPGSLVLLGGAPGIGKSTLLLQTARAVAATGAPVLYVSGEESLGQLKGRAARLGAVPRALQGLCETDIQRVVAETGRRELGLLVVDSIQAMFDPELASAPGSVAQVRECAARLMYLAKSTGLAIFMVGHATKDGSLAGPRVLEHLVDAVLELESTPGQEHRVLRSRKNRFGSTRELGVFEMTGEGLTEVTNPSELFLSERAPPTPGAVVTATLEGTRPLLVEVQALVAPTPYGSPRRTSSGFDAARVGLLAAVLDRRAGVDLLGSDIFINVTGGLDLSEPAADLAVALALVSSFRDRVIPPGRVVFGEVGLGGEIRAVAQPEARVHEARRLGFSSAMVPASRRLDEIGPRFDVVRVESLAEALETL